MSAPVAEDPQAETQRAAARAEIDALRARKTALDDDSIDLILRRARSHHTWLDRPVDAAFLAGTTRRSNFPCSIGYADTRGLFQRLPRYEFDEVCRFL